MAEVLEKARKRLAEIEAEAVRLRDFIALYEALSVSETVDIGDIAEAIVIPATEGTTPRKRGTTPLRIVEGAISAIRQHGRPMTRSELVKVLEDQGYTIGGRDKNKNMGTILWRSKKFENVEGEGYWPLSEGPWNRKFELSS